MRRGPPFGKSCAPVIRYIIRRLLWGVVLLVAVSALTFVIFFVLPSGDPAQLQAGPRAGPDLIPSVRHQLHLDEPKIQQFGRYMQGVFFHFDLGHSYQNDTNVRQQIFSRLPATLSLTLGAVVVWLAGASPGGIATPPGSARSWTGSRWAARWWPSRRRSTGSASSASTCSPTTSGASRSFRESGRTSPCPRTPRSGSPRCC